MEKNAARNGTGRKRLLIFLLSLCSAFLYGQYHDETLSVHIRETEFFVGSEFHMTLFVAKDFPYLKYRTEIPRLTLEQEALSAVSLESSASREFDGLHFSCTYRLTQSGTFTFSPVLQWNRQSVRLAPFTLIVHQPPLSEKTSFSWKVCTLDAEPLQNDVPLYQGQSYLICLTAAFFSSTAPAHDTLPFLLELPSELVRIDCPSPENAVLEKPAAEDLPPEITALVSREAEEHILTVFRWTPLKTGVQRLPEARLFFASGAETGSAEMRWAVNPQIAQPAAVAGEFPQQPADTFAEAFAAAEMQNNESDSDMQAEIRTAEKLAEYRRQESVAFFPYRIRRERKKLETELHIVRSLPLHPRIFRLMAAVAAAVLSVLIIVCFFKKKRRVLPFLIAAACACGIGTALLFRYALLNQGVCIASYEAATVRRIPEAAGTAVHQLAIGESVIIVRKTAQWCYIKTAGGISGWVFRKSIRELAELNHRSL